MYVFKTINNKAIRGEVTNTPAVGHQNPAILWNSFVKLLAPMALTDNFSLAPMAVIGAFQMAPSLAPMTANGAMQMAPLAIVTVAHNDVGANRHWCPTDLIGANVIVRHCGDRKICGKASTAV